MKTARRITQRGPIVDVLARGLCIALALWFTTPSRAGKADDELVRECESLVKRMGPESSENYAVRYFITPTAQCKNQRAAKTFCDFVQTYDGYKTLAEDAGLLPDPSDPDYANMTHARDRAARLCGTTTEAIRAGLCGKADASKQWKFAYAECPIEGRQIYLRECLKPHVLIGEGGGGTVRTTEAECAQRYQSRAKGW